MQLRSRVLDIPANIVVLHVSGKIVASALAPLEKQIDEMIEKSPIKLILDLQKVDGIDSQGVGALIRARYEIVSRGGKVVLIGVAERVMTILQISGLVDYFVMAASEFKAIQLLEEE